MQSKRLRRFFWTLWEPTEAESIAIAGLFDVDTCSYLVHCLERGHPDDPRLHSHGVVCYKSPRTWAQLKSVAERIHAEPVKSLSDVIQYVKKDGEFTEYGDCPAQGKRTDIERARDMLASGATMSDMIDSARTLTQIKFAQMWFTYRAPVRDFDTFVLWLHGPTGTGKSRYASALFSDVYYKDPSSQWWDGYIGQQVTVLDDFRAGNFQFSQILRLFDRYPLPVQFKGGYTQFRSRVLVVTTPFSPEETFAYRTQRHPEDVNQLLRRINLVVELPEFDLSTGQRLYDALAGDPYLLSDYLVSDFSL